MDYLATATDVAAIAGVVVTTASAICAMTKTPDPATTLGKAYRVLEILGLVVGRAKQLGIMPDNAAADRVGAKVVDGARRILSKSAPAIALCIGLGLAACAVGPAVEKQKADPKLIDNIKTACLGSGLFKLAGAGLSLAVPALSLPEAAVTAGIDKVCADPERYAGDVSTAEWVVKNTAQAFKK